MPTYDVHFQPVSADQTYRAKAFTFGFKTSLKVTGFQALVNRWAKTFMTPKGSDLLHPSEGTTFASLINANAPRNQISQVQDVIIISIDDANAQIHAQDLVGVYTPDEMLQTAHMVGYQSTATGESVDVWVEITNLAGTSLTLRLADMATR